MEHRIRAAVLVFKQDRLLLVKHVDPDTSWEWWIPPGGGFEAQEVFEETGLRVHIGRLIYLREYLESNPAVHHVELYFLADDYSGNLTLENIHGKGPDEDLIQEVNWLDRNELQSLTVYPEMLKNEFWVDRRAGFPDVRYLGIQTES